MTKIQDAKKIIEEADKIVIGAGAGLSAAAGLTYSGSRFEVFFKDYIVRYGMQDMYSAAFYPFETAEERWVIGLSISIIIVTSQRDFCFIEIFSTWLRTRIIL